MPLCIRTVFDLFLCRHSSLRSEDLKFPKIGNHFFKEKHVSFEMRRICDFGWGLKQHWLPFQKFCFTWISTFSPLNWKVVFQLYSNHTSAQFSCKRERSSISCSEKGSSHYHLVRCFFGFWIFFFRPLQPIQDLVGGTLRLKYWGKNDIHLHMQMGFFLSNVNRKLWQVFTERLTIRT